MLYTYILEDSIKSLTLILTADHSTLLFLPSFFFYKIKNFLFLLWGNLYMITGIYFHDLPPFSGPFFMIPPHNKCIISKNLLYKNSETVVLPALAKALENNKFLNNFLLGFFSFLSLSVNCFVFSDNLDIIFLQFFLHGF